MSKQKRPRRNFFILNCKSKQNFETFSIRQHFRLRAMQWIIEILICKQLYLFNKLICATRICVSLIQDFSSTDLWEFVFSSLLGLNDDMTTKIWTIFTHRMEESFDEYVPWLKCSCLKKSVALHPMVVWRLQSSHI